MKMIAHFNQCQDVVLLRFNDDTIIKIRAELDKDGKPYMQRVAPDIDDRLRMGVITLADHQRLTEDAANRERERRIDKSLGIAWDLYCVYGEEAGFQRPTKYPSVMQKKIDKIVWGFNAQRCTVEHEGTTYTVERPQQ